MFDRKERANHTRAPANHRPSLSGPTQVERDTKSKHKHEILDKINYPTCTFCMQCKESDP